MEGFGIKVLLPRGFRILPQIRDNRITVAVGSVHGGHGPDQVIDLLYGFCSHRKAQFAEVAGQFLQIKAPVVDGNIGAADDIRAYLVIEGGDQAGAFRQMIEIPEGIGAATIIMAGMKELNEKFGHEKGDSDIREFAEILQDAAPDDCFIGRNGGIKFLLIFPQWTPKDWRAFETALAGRVRERNEASPEGDTLACVIGVAYQGEEEANSFSELVAMSDRRAAAKLSGPSPKSAGAGDTEK